MKVTLPLLLAALALTACGVTMPFGGRNSDAPAADVRVTEMPGEDVMRPRARGSAEAPAPPPTPDADGFLGETLAGLGAPGESGLWLRTGLVDAVRLGTITTEAGRSLTLELRPSGTDSNAGSQLSLAAMQSLGVPLNQLVTLRVSIASH